MTLKKSHAKELFSHTLIYGLGIVLNKSVNFILLPVYTKYFPPEQIGLFTLVQSLSLFLGVIYTFGIETSFMKYFIESDNVKSKAEIYSSALISLFFTSLLLSLLIYSQSGNISLLFNFDNFGESSFMIKILCILMFVDTLYRFPLLLFRAELKTVTYAWINLITFIVNIICNVLFIIVFKFGVESIFYCYIISTIVTLIIGLIYTGKYLSFNISFEKIKKLFAYGNKFIYIGLFMILIDMSDKFFLKYYFDESVVGIYWANYRLATIMSLVIAAFRFSWTPYFLNLTANPDNKKIISNIFTYFIFAGMFLFLILCLFINNIVEISFAGYSLLDVSYRSGTGIIPFIMLAYIFSGLFSILNAAPFFTNKTGSLFAFSLSGLILNVLFNFLLIPKYEIMGAAIATLITYGLMSLIMYLYSQKIYNIDYDWVKIRKLLLMSGIVFVAGYIFVNNAFAGSPTGFIINLVLIVLFLTAVDKMKIVELKKFKTLFSR